MLASLISKHEARKHKKLSRHISEVTESGFKYYKLSSSYSKNYKKEETDKAGIVLHHTVGYLGGDIDTLTNQGNSSSRRNVCVAYVVARNGNVYQLFDPKYWAYHLGRGAVGGNTYGCKRTIAIEISNIGWLDKKQGELITPYKDKYCDIKDEEYYLDLGAEKPYGKSSFRGKQFYATFTSSQYKSLKSLLKMLCGKFDIPYSFLPENERFEIFQSPSEAKQYKGIASHSNYRPSGIWELGPAFDWEKLVEPAGPEFSLPLNIGGGLEVTSKSIKKYYVHTEADHLGGYFPVGVNNAWHGAVHLHGRKGAKVKAMASGVIVAARLAAEDKAEHYYGSNNFILIKHKYQDVDYYSLYQHLHWEELKLSNRNLKQIPWINKSPGSYKKKLNKELLEQLETGDVRKINQPVSAGETIWTLGEAGSEKIRKPTLHWQIFSEKLLPGYWEKVKDGNKNFTCEPEKIIDLIDNSSEKFQGFNISFQENGMIGKGELKEFYKNSKKCAPLRQYACKFLIESAVNWGSDASDLEEKFSTEELSDKLKPYSFWQEAKKAEVDLPADSVLWHYNPINVLEQAMPPEIELESETEEAIELESETEEAIELESETEEAIEPEPETEEAIEPEPETEASEDFFVDVSFRGSGAKKGCYIYIFAKEKAEFYREIKVVDNGQYAEAKDEGGDWNEDCLDEIRIDDVFDTEDAKEEFFFCSSRFRFSKDYINHICATPKPRCLAVQMSPGSSVIKIQLVDYLAVAEEFAIEFQKSVENSLEYLEAEKEKIYLAKQILALCEQDSDLKKNLKSFEAVEAVVYKYKDEVNEKAENLVSFLESSEYKEVEKDYIFDPIKKKIGNPQLNFENHLAAIYSNMSFSEKTVAYIKRQCRDDYLSYISQIILKTHEAVTSAHKAFFDILESLVPIFAKDVYRLKTPDKIIELFRHRGIKMSYKGLNVSYDINKVVNEVSFKDISKGVRISKFIKKYRKPFKVDFIKFSGRALAYISGFLELGLALNTKSKTKEEKIKKGLSMAAAMANIAENSKYIHSLAKDAGARKAAFKLSKGIGSQAGRRIAARSMFGVAGSFISAGLDAWTAWTAFEEGDTDEAAFLGISAVLGVAAGIALIAGAPVIAGVATLAVAIAGICAIFANDTPLEEFVSHCHWGEGEPEKFKKLKRDWIGKNVNREGWKDNFGDQIEALHKIFYAPHVKVKAIFEVEKFHGMLFFTEIQITLKSDFDIRTVQNKKLMLDIWIGDEKEAKHHVLKDYDIFKNNLKAVMPTSDFTGIEKIEKLILVDDRVKTGKYTEIPAKGLISALNATIDRTEEPSSAKPPVLYYEVSYTPDDKSEFPGNTGEATCDIDFLGILEWKTKPEYFQEQEKSFLDKW